MLLFIYIEATLDINTAVLHLGLYEQKIKALQF